MNLKFAWELLLLRRHVVAFLAFLGCFNIYFLRANLSIGVVSMTQNYTLIDENGTEMSHKPNFEWNSEEKGILLSSFFYGYIFTQIPGGWLATKIGGTKVFGIGILITGVLTLLTPLCANFGISILIAVRILEGFFEGVTFPSMHVVWSRWAPPQERTRLVSFAGSGGYFGTMIAFPVCGFLADKFGWPSMFYCSGIIAIIWYLLWITFVRDDPEKDSRITENELMYLKEALADVKQNHITLPWKKFFTSMPVWAIINAHCCENWGFYLMLTQLPSFMSDTLQFDIQAAGLLSALPYLVMSATLQVAGFVTDYLRKNKICTTTQIRKLCICSGFSFQTIFLILTSYANTTFSCILFITLSISLGAFATSGFAVNHLDIAPQHAGILYGISNTFATVSGIVAPMVTGYLVKNKSKAEWRIVFFISGVIYLFGAIFYGVFGSGDRQPWAIDDNESKTPVNDLKKDECEDYAIKY